MFSLAHSSSSSSSSSSSARTFGAVDVKCQSVRLRINQKNGQYMTKEGRQTKPTPRNQTARSVLVFRSHARRRRLLSLVALDVVGFFRSPPGVVDLFSASLGVVFRRSSLVVIAVVRSSFVVVDVYTAVGM
jgi:hypothetical protein